MGRKKRRPAKNKPQKRLPVPPCGELLSWHELASMHAEIRHLCRGGRGPGTEEYSLMCSLGWCLGKWPMLTKAKIKQLRDRMERLGFSEYAQDQQV